MTPTWIIIHHSVTPTELDDNKSESSFNANHKARGFPLSKTAWNIGYHYVIYSSGEKRQYRADNEIGAHCKEGKMNYNSIGICLEGNFDVEEPTLAQCKAALQLISELQSKYSIPNTKVRPHRYYATGTLNNDTQWATCNNKKPYKSCWGNKLPDDIISYLGSKAAFNQTELNIPMPKTGQKEHDFFKQLGFFTQPKDLEKPLTAGETFVILKHLFDNTKKV